MRQVLDDLFVWRGNRVMSWPRAAVYLAILAVANGWWYRADFAAAVPLPADGHAIVSLNVAVNRAFCHHPSRLSNNADVARLLQAEPALVTRPIAGVIAENWQSVEAYCASVVVPYVNNENSLMLLENWIMRAIPDVSLASVGQIMLWLRVLVVLLFCLALLRSGVSVLVCAGVLEIAAAILHQLQPVFAYSVYAFFLPLTLLPIAIYLLTAGISRRVPVRMAVALITGVASAYGTNMRTSYLPLFVMFFLIYLAAGEWTATERGRTWRQRLAVSAAALALFAVGYGAFHYTFITRSRPEGNTQPSHHVIWHSVVMSLAIPANPLSEREGIKWNDGTGWDLARRINPAVPYLGPGYEEALRSYYFDLWRRYPAEMRQIYLEKFKLGGRHMIEIAKFDSTLVTAILGVLAYLPNGLWLAAALLIASAAAVWRYVRSASRAMLAFLYLTTIAILLYLEGSAIMPYYYLTYQSTLLFGCAAATVAVGQLLLNAPVLLVQRLTGAPAAKTHGA